MFYNFKVDTSELLKDKSCCSVLSKWTTEYDRRYCKERYGVNPPKVKGSQKLVILEYLDCEELIMKFVNEMLIAIRAWKEKKMNGKKGRVFTKLVFEPRIYQTSCEGNMKQVMEYFPFQTITKGGDALTKLLMNISQKGYLRTSIDFQSWCDFWCNDVLKGYLEFLDDIFGLKGVYSKLHIIAEEINVC